MNRKQRVTEVLERLQKDRAATPAEKAEAQRAIDRLKNIPIHSDKKRISWDHGRWRDNMVDNAATFRMYTENATSMLGKVRLRFTQSFCTDNQWNYILAICKQNEWTPPISKITFAQAQAWLNYFVRKDTYYK